MPWGVIRGMRDDYRPDGFFPALELEMLAAEVDMRNRMAEAEQYVTVTPSGCVTAPAPRMDDWRDAAEAAAAYTAFPPTRWWDDPTGRKRWNCPPAE